MLTNLSRHFCNMLHHTTACRTICHISLHGVNVYLLKPDCSASPYFWKIVWRSEVAVECGVWTAEGVCCSATGYLTSPRGPGSPTRPVLQWCRVCRRIPGCCVGSEALSSETPDSSCPAGTCSTIHQPPSHQTPCHLRYTVWGLGWLQWVYRGITNFARTRAEWSFYKIQAFNGNVL